MKSQGQGEIVLRSVGIDKSVGIQVMRTARGFSGLARCGMLPETRTKGQSRIGDWVMRIALIIIALCVGVAMMAGGTAWIIYYLTTRRKKDER